MRNSFKSILLTALLFAVIAVVGCSRNAPPPEPIALDQLPAAMEKAFASAKGEAKEVADQVVAAVNAKDFAKAAAGLQKLTVLNGLSKEQVNTAARSVLSVNQALQEAQSKGDQKAVQTLKSYQINK